VIKCPTCWTVLRSIPGLHQAGDPYIRTDEQGSYMECLKCETKVRWKDDDEPALDFDIGDDTALE